MKLDTHKLKLSDLMDELEEIKDLQKRIDAMADTIVGLENSIIRMREEQIELKKQWNVKTYC